MKCFTIYFDKEFHKWFLISLFDYLKLTCAWDVIDMRWTWPKIQFITFLTVDIFDNYSENIAVFIAWIPPKSCSLLTRKFCHAPTLLSLKIKLNSSLFSTKLSITGTSVGLITGWKTGRTPAVITESISTTSVSIYGIVSEDISWPINIYFIAKFLK